MTAAEPDTATYVFAVCRRVDPAVLRGLEGIGYGAAVRPLGLGPLTAVVQHLPAREAGEDAWQARLSDATALERTARAHHEVVRAVARHTTTVPLALATLYLGDDRARQVLAKDIERFSAVLRRIDGCDEWGIKVYATGAAVPPATPVSAGATQPPPSAGDGHAYLARRRAEHHARDLRQHDAQRIADTVDSTLRVLVSAARRLRPHAAHLTGERAPQVLNAAYLVPRERAAGFQRAVGALRRRTGARIEVTGPWVPYSFAALPDAATPGDTPGRGRA